VGGQIAVQPGEGGAGAAGPGQLERPVEAEEADPLGRGPVPVVLAHPAHELPVGGRPAEPVAEAAPHDVVERPGALRDVRVHDQCREAVALDRDRPVTLVLHEVAEGLVALPEERLLAVRGLAEGEQARRSRERPEQFRDRGALEGPAGVDDRGFHTFDRIVEPSV
jgi:hypothetical protein